jgi:hypothetical protein
MVDVFGHRRGQFDSSKPKLAVQQLNLHLPPEGLNHHVVVAITDGSHRYFEVIAIRMLRERPRRGLGAVISVQNSAWLS